MHTSIAMWSGPRNISTAMMRAWENRTDCHVVDEPFYAPFLKNTDIEHPMRDVILQEHESDVDKVVDLVGKPHSNKVFYQKHISTHMLDSVPLEWLANVTNIFLIRDPRYMVASYSVKRESATADDLGYTRLEKLFKYAQSVEGRIPLVIDSRRFLEKPEAYLRHICTYLAIDFQESMLSWPTGTRETDGVWQAHWYDSVNKSTGFGPARSNQPELDSDQQALADACIPHFDALNEHALIL